MSIENLLLIGHVLISGMIIALVLLQRGKGAEAGTAFGAGASGTVFGAKGSANFLSRTTAVLATLFFLNSLGLAYLGANRDTPTGLMEQTIAEPATIEALPVPAEGETDIDALPALPDSGDSGAAEIPGDTVTEAPEQ